MRIGECKELNGQQLNIEQWVGTDELKHSDRNGTSCGACLELEREWPYCTSWSWKLPQLFQTGTDRSWNLKSSELFRTRTIEWDLLGGPKWMTNCNSSVLQFTSVNRNFGTQFVRKQPISNTHTNHCHVWE